MDVALWFYKWDWVWMGWYLGGLQSVTYRYREFPVSGIFHFFVVLEKIGTGKKSRNRYRKILVPEKSPGTGIGKIWYRKKVSEPVSEKFGTGKSLGTGIGQIWYRKKYRYRYHLKFGVPSHTGRSETQNGKLKFKVQGSHTICCTSEQFEN